MNMCVYMAMTSAWHLVYVYVCNDLQIKTIKLKINIKRVWRCAFVMCVIVD